MQAFVARPHVYTKSHPSSGICREPLWAKGCHVVSFLPPFSASPQYFTLPHSHGGSRRVASRAPGMFFLFFFLNCINNNLPTGMPTPTTGPRYVFFFKFMFFNALTIIFKV